MGRGIVAAAPCLVVLSIAAVPACIGDDATTGAAAGADAGATPDGSPAGADAATDGDVPSDAGGDGGVRACDPTSTFTTVEPVDALEAIAPYEDMGAHLTADELHVFWISNRDQKPALYHADRASVAQPFGNLSVVTVALTGNGSPTSAAVADDPTALFLGVEESGALPHALIEVSRLVGGKWQDATAVPGADFGTPKATSHPYLSPDGKTMVFHGDDVDAGKGTRLYVATRSGTDVTFSSNAVIAELASSNASERAPVLARDALTIYFASNRGKSAGSDDYDVWVARRSSPKDAFGAPLQVQGSSVLDAHDEPSWISADQCTMYLSSNRSGRTQIYKATRTPL